MTCCPDCVLYGQWCTVPEKDWKLDCPEWQPNEGRKPMTTRAGTIRAKFLAESQALDDEFLTTRNALDKKFQAECNAPKEEQ